MQQSHFQGVLSNRVLEALDTSIALIQRHLSHCHAKNPIYAVDRCLGIIACVAGHDQSLTVYSPALDGQRSLGLLLPFLPHSAS
jgi:hypothetical protein